MYLAFRVRTQFNLWHLFNLLTTIILRLFYITLKMTQDQQSSISTRIWHIEYGPSHHQVDGTEINLVCQHQFSNKLSKHETSTTPGQSEYRLQQTPTSTFSRSLRLEKLLFRNRSESLFCIELVS